MSSIMVSETKSGLKDPRFLLILVRTKDAISKIKDLISILVVIGYSNFFRLQIHHAITFSR